MFPPRPPSQRIRRPILSETAVEQSSPVRGGGNFKIEPASGGVTGARLVGCAGGGFAGDFGKH